MDRYDAIAVGGGLAGGAFAVALARAGLKVAVIERTRGAHLKVCGDFHSREAQELLSHIGVDPGRLGAKRMGTFRFASGHAAAAMPLPFSAIGLSRTLLDEALLEAAADAGADIIRGESATGIDVAPESDASSVTVVRIGGRKIAAPAVALATGKHNLRGRPRERGPLTAFKIQFEPTAAAARLLDGVVQLVAYDGGYVGACIVEGGAVSICWLADAALMQATGGNWRSQLALIGVGSRHFSALIEGARYLSEEPAAISAIPFGYTRREVIGDAVYPVGDQLAVIPSLTGDGTSLALASGLRAAGAVLKGQPAGAFQRESLARVKAQFLWARAVHLSFTSRPLRAMSVGVIGAVPWLATKLTVATRTKGIEALLAQPAGSLAAR
jgi:flavin-dependent dehydrogenase